MAQEYSRTQRVADQIQRELAALIQREVKDPRVGMATVSAVEVSRDLSHAKVFVTILNGDEDQQEITESVKALNNASGFFAQPTWPAYEAAHCSNLEVSF